YQELLDYLNTLPNANPLMRKTLEDLIAKEKAGKTPTETAATKPAVTAAKKKAQTQPAEKRYLKMPESVTHMLRLNQRDGKTYLCLEDSNLIYEVDDKIFENASAEMHHHEITKFEVDKVTDLEFHTEAADIVLHKSGDDWKYLTDPHLPIDKQKVTDVLNAFREIKTDRYLEYDAKNLAKYNLDKNFDRVVITLEGTRKTEILLSKQGPPDDPEKSRYALRAGAGPKKVFLLQGSTADKFNQKLEDFEKK
ncbi:MAG: DUF4340 domain-containing protein, partial [Planctomycetota bacterium]